jgi:hypothetical protein
MRFSQLPAHITQGFRALKVIELPLASQPHGLQPDTPEQIEARGDSEIVKPMVGLRALTPEERSDVLAAAFARAVSKGATGDVEKSAVYNQALAVYTVAQACVDPDSDRCKPFLFFGDNLESAADTIRKSVLMTDDIVLYLRERQECWQDEVHPQALTIRDTELYEIAKAAADDADFLFRMRPGMLINYALTLGALCVSLAEASNTDTSVSINAGLETKTNVSSPPSEPEPVKATRAKRIRKSN